MPPIFIAHTGDHITPPASPIVSPALAAFIFDAVSVPPEDQVLLTERGRVVKPGSSIANTAVFLFDKGLLAKYNPSRPDELVTKVSGPKFVGISDVDDEDGFSRDVPPPEPSNPESLSAWKEVFAARQDWCASKLALARNLADTAVVYSSQQSVVQWSALVAIMSQNNYVRKLERKGADLGEWFHGVEAECTDNEDSLKSRFHAFSQVKIPVTGLRKAMYSPSPTLLLPELDEPPTHSEETLDRIIETWDTLRSLKVVDETRSTFRRNLQLALEDVGSVSCRTSDLMAELQAEVDNQPRDTVTQHVDSLINRLEGLVERISISGEGMIRLQPKDGGRDRMSAEVRARVAKVSMEQERLFPTVLHIVQQLKEMNEQAAEAKNEASVRFLAQMHEISKLQSDCDSSKETLGGLQLPPDSIEAFTMLATVRNLPRVWGRLMLEAVRRSEWDAAVRDTGAQTSQEVERGLRDEIDRRNNWKEGLEDFLSDFGRAENMMNVSILFDEQNQSQWPEVSRDDLAYYIEQLEAMTEYAEVGADLRNMATTELEAASAAAAQMFLSRSEVDLMIYERNKFEEEVRAQKSRVRKLEDLLHRHSQQHPHSGGSRPVSRIDEFDSLPLEDPRDTEMAILAAKLEDAQVQNEDLETFLERARDSAREAEDAARVMDQKAAQAEERAALAEKQVAQLENQLSSLKEQVAKLPEELDRTRRERDALERTICDAVEIQAQGLRLGNVELENAFSEGSLKDESISSRLMLLSKQTSMTLQKQSAQLQLQADTVAKHEGQIRQLTQTIEGNVKTIEEQDKMISSLEAHPQLAQTQKLACSLDVQLQAAIANKTRLERQLAGEQAISKSLRGKGKRLTDVLWKFVEQSGHLASLSMSANGLEDLGTDANDSTRQKIKQASAEKARDWLTAEGESQQKLFDLLTSAAESIDLVAVSDGFKQQLSRLEKAMEDNRREAHARAQMVQQARREGGEKIAFRNFKVGDLVLFLPARSMGPSAAATPSSIRESEPSAFPPTRVEAPTSNTQSTTLAVPRDITVKWAAFNVGAPHYFLNHHSHQLEGRQWMVGRVRRIREIRKAMSSVPTVPSSLISASIPSGMTQSMSVTDVDSDAYPSSSLSPGAQPDGPGSSGDYSAPSLSPSHITAPSTLPRWFIIDAVEEKAQAPATPGLSSSTVQTSTVGARGRTVWKGGSSGDSAIPASGPVLASAISTPLGASGLSASAAVSAAAGNGQSRHVRNKSSVGTIQSTASSGSLTGTSSGGAPKGSSLGIGMGLAASLSRTLHNIGLGGKGSRSSDSEPTSSDASTNLPLSHSPRPTSSTALPSTSTQSSLPLSSVAHNAHYRNTSTNGGLSTSARHQGQDQPQHHQRTAFSKEMPIPSTPRDHDSPATSFSTPASIAIPIPTGNSSSLLSTTPKDKPRDGSRDNASDLLAFRLAFNK